MPCLRIETNVAKSAINVEEFSTELTAAVAKTLSKPIGYCMVSIVPDSLLVNLPISLPGSYWQRLSTLFVACVPWGLNLCSLYQGTLYTQEGYGTVCAVVNQLWARQILS